MLRQLASYLQNFGRSRKMTSATKTRSPFVRRTRLTVELLEKRDVPSGTPPVTMLNPGNQTNYDGDGVNLALVANDTTPGATLAYSASGLPSGLSMDAGTGVVTGTIDSTADLSSPNTVTFTAADGSASASRTITWVVNNPVALTSPGDQTNYDGDVVNMAISVSDAKGIPTFSASGLPPGLSVDSGTGIISGTIAINADVNGPYVVTLTAGDGTYSTSQTVNWAVNNPVTVTNPGNQTNYNNDQVSLPVSANDATGGTLTFSATGLPMGLAINPNTGVISGGTIMDGSPFTVTVTATDGTYSASQTFGWTVTPYPVSLVNVGTQFNAVGDSVSVPVGITDSISNSPIYSATSLPPGLSIDSSTGIITGTISSGADANSPYMSVVTATDGNFSDSEAFPWVVQQAPQTVTWQVTTLNDTAADNAANGPQDANGDISLRSAIQAGNALAAGTNIQISFQANLSGTITLATALPDLNRSFNISGPTGVVEVTRSSQANTPNFRIFTIGGGGQYCDISNLTITNGYAAAANGGGIFCAAGSSVNLYNLTLTSNVADDFGGGVDSLGTLTVENCRVGVNYAGMAGGGIANGGQAWVSDSSIFLNSAVDNGGGIWNSGIGTTFNLDNSQVVYNAQYFAVGLGGGGGISNSSGTFTANGGVIFENSSSGSGGGFYNDLNGTATLTDISITSNTAYPRGGGVYVAGGTTTLNSLVITNNRVLGQNGVFTAGAWANNATLNRNNLTFNANTDTFGQN